MARRARNLERLPFPRSVDLPGRSRRDGYGRAITAVLSICVVACGDARSDNAPGAASDAEAVAGDAPAQAVRDGHFELDGTTYTFRVARCDLTGRLYEGMVLQGRGTAVDGRQIAVSVDRTGSAMITENAFVSFGSMQQGDNWSASRTGLQDGRWFADEGATQPAGGPLIRTSGDELTVEAIFQRESDGSSQRGVLRAACPR